MFFLINEILECDIGYYNSLLTDAWGLMGPQPGPGGLWATTAN